VIGNIFGQRDLSTYSLFGILSYNIPMALSFRKNIGIVTIIILCSIPIGRWFFLSPLALRFLDTNTTMTSLGQIAGLLGMVLFALNLILSGRFKMLDEFFYGLNILYNYHQKIGAVAFSLLLFHPLFLVVKYLGISLRSAALFLLPGGDLAIGCGVIALTLMIVLIGFTFYGKFKYQNWKLSHKFMVGVFIFAILHTTFIASDISRDIFLRYYILGLAYVGLACGFYRAFLSSYFNINYHYIINRITTLNANVVEIEMSPQGKRVEFLPGQFVFISFNDKVVGSEIHPFSITSVPNENNFKLVVKALGDYTERLKNLKIGSSASIEGPFGKFSYANIPSKDQIWIAGGVGITPFISMAKSLHGSEFKVDLYYCTKNSAEAVLFDELSHVTTVNKNFNIFSWCSDDKGRISAQKISEMSHGFVNKDILLCGPAPFMISLRNQLLELKIERSRIHWEQFAFL
jgi:predicted ferric reductase